MNTLYFNYALEVEKTASITQAAAKFLCSFDNSREMELDILETSSLNVIEKVAAGKRAAMWH